MISHSPFSESHQVPASDREDSQKLRSFTQNDRPTVVVQGLGFVGTAMLAALAQCKNSLGTPLYNVIGVDLRTERDYWKIARINQGLSPIATADQNIHNALKSGIAQGNLVATCNPEAYQYGSTILIDINLDIQKKELGNAYEAHFDYRPLIRAVETIGAHCAPNALVILESTVPPGTTEKIVAPTLTKALMARDLNPNGLAIAHSYERVMPGPKYFDSIINYYRVFSGLNQKAAQRARAFFETFLNIKDYPLTELDSPTASEMAKVLENSYRAMNIAFIHEWTKFAHTAGVDLFQVIGAIKKRSTHNNIMLPGLGVGGYCLTKDALIADWGMRHNFGSTEHLNFSLKAVETNDLMPDFTFELAQSTAKSLASRQVTIMGVSYLNGVGDTRFTPVAQLYDQLIKAGAKVCLHDPLVSLWDEKSLKVLTQFSEVKNQKHDVVIMTVRHAEYLALSAKDWMALLPGMKIAIDAFNVLSNDVITELQDSGVTVAAVGKGQFDTKFKGET